MAKNYIFHAPIGALIYVIKAKFKICTFGVFGRINKGTTEKLENEDDKRWEEVRKDGKKGKMNE